VNEHQSQVDEIECILGQRIRFDVVLSHFDVRQTEVLEKSGVEIRRQAVDEANALRGDLPITFEVGDLNVWTPTRHYDVLVMLAILHKLKRPQEVLRRLLVDASPDLIVMRLPPHDENPCVLDERSGGKKIDLWPTINKMGYKLLHGTAGYLNEWIGYYRRAA